METKIAAIHRKMPMPARQLPINGFAHKTGIIGDPRHAAVVASLHVAAERLGPARHDRAHHAPLDATEMTGTVTTIGVAMPAQDIGDLDGGSGWADVGASHNPHPDALSSRWRHFQR
jgi:hypothetical protein